MNESPKPLPEASDTPKQRIPSSISGSAGILIVDAFGPLAQEIGRDLLTAYQRWKWRSENLDRIAKQYEAEVKNRGIDPTPLPEGDAFRVIEAASLEDEPSIQKLWAGLIASAVDPSSAVTASKVFIELLKAIGPAEAGLLELLHLIDLPLYPVEKTTESIIEARKKALEKLNAFANQRWRCFDQEARENATQNLMRLRCVGFRTGKQLKANDLMRSIPIGMDRQKAPASAHALAEMVDYLENLALAASGTGTVPAHRTRSTNEVQEARYQLTSLGRSLMRACLADS